MQAFLYHICNIRIKDMFPQVQLERVKAHHTDKYNNFVDKLARKEAGSI